MSELQGASDHPIPLHTGEDFQVGAAPLSPEGQKRPDITGSSSVSVTGQPHPRPIGQLPALPSGAAGAQQQPPPGQSTRPKKEQRDYKLLEQMAAGKTVDVSPEQRRRLEILIDMAAELNSKKWYSKAGRSKEDSMTALLGNLKQTAGLVPQAHAAMARHVLNAVGKADAEAIKNLKSRIKTPPTPDQPKPAALQRPVLITVDNFIKGVQANPYSRSPHMNMCVEALKYSLANRNQLTQTEDDIILDHLGIVSGADVRNKYGKAEQDEMVAAIKKALGGDLSKLDYDPAEAARAHLMDKPIDDKAKPSLLECLARMRRGEDLPDNPTWNPVKQKVAALAKAKDDADLDTKITAALRELGEKPASEAEAVDQIVALLQAKPIKPQDDKEKIAADADKSKIPENSSFDKVLELADKGFTLSDLQKRDIDNLRGVLTENKAARKPEELVRAFLTLRGDNPLSIDDAAIQRILAHIDKLDKAADAKPPAAASFTSPSIPPDAVIAYGKHAPLPPGRPFLTALQHIDAPGWLSASEGRLFDALATRMKRAPKEDHPKIIAHFLETLEKTGQKQVDDPAQKLAYAQQVQVRMNSLLVRRDGDKASLLDMQRVAESGGLLTQQQNTTMQTVMQGVRALQTPSHKAGDAAIYLQQFLQAHGQLPTSRTEAEAMIGDIIKLTKDLDGKPVGTALPEPPAPSATRTIDRFSDALKLQMDKKPLPRGAAQFQLDTLVKTLDQQLASQPSLDDAAIKKIVRDHLLKIGIVSANDAQIDGVVHQLETYIKPTLTQYSALVSTPGPVPNTKGWKVKAQEVNGKLKVLQAELDKQLIGPRTSADAFNEVAFKEKCMETAFPELSGTVAPDRSSLFQAIWALHNMTVTPAVVPPDIPVTPPTQAIPADGAILSRTQLSELYEKNIALKMMTEDDEIALFLKRNFTNFPIDAAQQKLVIDRVKEQRMQSFIAALQLHVKDPTITNSLFKPEDLVRHLLVGERNDTALESMIKAHFKDCKINPEDEVVKRHIPEIRDFLRANVSTPPGGPSRQPSYLQFLEHVDTKKGKLPDPPLPRWQEKHEALKELQETLFHALAGGTLEISDVDDFIKNFLKLPGDGNDAQVISLIKKLYPPAVPTTAILQNLVDEIPLPAGDTWSKIKDDLEALKGELESLDLTEPPVIPKPGETVISVDDKKNLLIEKYLEGRGEFIGLDDAGRKKLIADVKALLPKLPVAAPPLPSLQPTADFPDVSTRAILQGLVKGGKKLPAGDEWDKKWDELSLLPMNIRLAALNTATLAEAEKNVIREYLKEKGELSGVADDDDKLIGEVRDLLNELPKDKPVGAAKVEDEIELVLVKPAAEFLKEIQALGPMASASDDIMNLQSEIDKILEENGVTQEQAKGDEAIKPLLDAAIRDFLEIEDPAEEKESVAAIREQFLTNRFIQQI